MPSLIVFLLSTLFVTPSHANPASFPVELQLPVVTLVSASGEERKLEISLSGEFTVDAGKAILRNVVVHSPTQVEVSLDADVRRVLRNLLMEVSSFNIATGLFRAQMEHFQSKKNERFSDEPFQLTDKELTVWDVPLKFAQAKASTRLTQMRFLQASNGKVEKVVASTTDGRNCDLADLEPQMETLNPWESLGWVLAGKKARVGSVNLKDGLLSETVDFSKPGFQKWMQDEADRVLVRGRVVFLSQADEKAAKKKEAEEIANGCLKATGCGCAIAAAAGGGGLAAVYLVLSWLF